MKLKSLVTGTPLERPARRFLHMLIGGPRPTPIAESELREARDNACVRALLRSLLKRDSFCIDVGAHQGFFLRQFLEFAPIGQHFAFEPIPRLASELKHKFPSVKVYEYALSDYEGQSTFQFVPEFAVWSGLRRQPYPRATHPQSIPVTLRRLDNVVADGASIAFHSPKSTRRRTSLDITEKRIATISRFQFEGMCPARDRVLSQRWSAIGGFVRNQTKPNSVPATPATRYAYGIRSS